jgi:hypothetical protein
MNWLAVVAFLTVIISGLVYWFVLRKPSDPSTCTAGDSCTGSDPNGIYTYDSNCNCIISGCTGDYSLIKGSCVKSGGTCTPKDDCSSTIKNPDPDATYKYDDNCNCIKTCTYMTYPDGSCSTQDRVLPGYPPEAPDIRGTDKTPPINNLIDCRSYCAGTSGCKVYAWDGKNCYGYKDYYIDNTHSGHQGGLINPTVPNNMTYVLPFSFKDYPSFMAYIDDAVIDSSVTKKACKDSYDDCETECLGDEDCDAYVCGLEAPQKCVKYTMSDSSIINNIRSKRNYYTKVKVRSSS